MDDRSAPGLATLLLEVGRLWDAVREGVPRWGTRLLVVALLAGVFLVLYRLADRATDVAARRFPATGPWMRAIDASFRIVFTGLFLVSAAGLFPETAGLVAPLVRVLLIVLLLYVFWEITRHVLVGVLVRYALDASLRLLIQNLLRAVWLALGLYLVFQQFGINLLPILGGLGIAGVAIGFAAQDLLSNLISGVTLLLDRPFTIGDWIRVDEHEGQVHRITLRTTRIHTRDNESVSIPNSRIAGAVVENLSAGGPLRVRSSVSVAYGADLDAARAALMGVLSAEPLVLADPAPRIAVVELASSSITLDLIYWIAPETIARRPTVQQRVLEATTHALRDAGVEIPYPQMVVHLRSPGQA